MENLYILIAAFVSAVALGRMIIPNILIISLRKRLFDLPAARTVHQRTVPRLRGGSFVPVMLFALCMFSALRLLMGHGPDESKAAQLVCEFLFLVSGLTPLYIVGLPYGR